MFDSTSNLLLFKITPDMQEKSKGKHITCSSRHMYSQKTRPSKHVKTRFVKRTLKVDSKLCYFVSICCFLFSIF